MNGNTKYIPALHWKRLTPLYDPLLRWGMREERFKREMIQQAQIQTGQQVLDLGCGTATLTVMIKQAQQGAQVTGLDADLDALKIGQEKAEKAGVVLKLDHGMSYALPYPDASFDRVLSSLMFHHLTSQDKMRTMREVHRVLRPGGSFLVIDFGKPRGLWSKLVSPIMASLEEVADNHKMLLINMMGQAGFLAVGTRASFETIFGTLYLYQGRKQSR